MSPLPSVSNSLCRITLRNLGISIPRKSKNIFLLCHVSSVYRFPAEWFMIHLCLCCYVFGKLFWYDKSTETQSCRKIARIKLSNNNWIYFYWKFGMFFVYNFNKTLAGVVHCHFTAHITLPLHKYVQFRRAGRWDRHSECPQTVIWSSASDVLDVKCHRTP